MVAVAAAAVLALGVVVALAIPGHSAPITEEGTATLVIDTGVVDDAEQVVFDFERQDLDPLALSARLGGDVVDVRPSPFGASAVAQPHPGEQELVLTGAGGADLRVVVTYIDAGGAVLTRSSTTLSLAATEQPPVVVDPPGDPTDPPPPTADTDVDVTDGAATDGTPTEGSPTDSAATDGAAADDAATDSLLSITGVNAWLALSGLAALAAIAGGVFLIARKRVQA